MPVSSEYIDHLLQLLEPLGAVRTKRMFGGAGVFLDGTMFGLIVDDVLYLKADDENRSDFEERGLSPFTYTKKTRPEPVQLSYFEAPDDVFDDPGDLCVWAAKAWEAARRTAKGGAAKK
ncbi:MAG: TfoX/Sxy family protein [Rhodospirillales bacterium]|nr:TfoX/Sxy family protein [Rhodospirillales bacterium]